jgi:hypothetical protein
MWIFGFSLVVCSTESYSLVLSLRYLVSNRDKYSWEGIKLDGAATSDFQQNATESIPETWEWL